MSANKRQKSCSGQLLAHYAPCCTLPDCCTLHWIHAPFYFELLCK